MFGIILKLLVLTLSSEVIGNMGLSIFSLIPKSWQSAGSVYNIVLYALGCGLFTAEASVYTGLLNCVVLAPFVCL